MLPERVENKLDEKTEKVIQFLHQAKKMAVRFQKEGLREVETKPHDSIATQADVAIGKFLTEKLEDLYPGSLIVQEETADSGLVTPDMVGSGRVLTVDPIDSTSNYYNGMPFWSILVGRMENGQPVEGFAYFPRLDEFYYTKGDQAFCNHQLINAFEKPKRRDEAYMINTYPTFHENFNFQKGKEFRQYIISPMLYGSLFVARGQRDCLIARPGFFLWDIAPLLPIIRYAGAEVYYLRSGLPFEVADLFQIDEPAKEFLVVCREGKFEEAVQYIEPIDLEDYAFR